MGSNGVVIRFSVIVPASARPGAGLICRADFIRMIRSKPRKRPWLAADRAVVQVRPIESPALDLNEATVTKMVTKGRRILALEAPPRMGAERELDDYAYMCRKPSAVLPADDPVFDA